MNGVSLFPVAETKELRAAIPNGYVPRVQNATYGNYISSLNAWASREDVDPDRLEFLLFRTAPRRGRSPFFN